MVDVLSKFGKHRAMQHAIPLSAPARLFALLIAIAALGGQFTLTGLDLAEGDSLLGTLWGQARYFTNLMVYLTGAYCAVIAYRGEIKSVSWVSGITTWIVMVGLVYQVLLAKDHNPSGIKAVINEIQHAGVPAAMLLFWLAFVSRGDLIYRQALYWIACPLAYAVYATARGLGDGVFPYFFLNPDKTGWLGVLAYIIGLGAIFYLAGALLVWISRKRGT